ncbi:MAG: DUF4174 domain-containing protein [Bryobacter sp.]|jgi:hypothetical protein|nr:DUF4174 domain-containing protein [Bryobacter sp. CoA8 C33]
MFAAGALLLLMSLELESYRWRKRILLQLGGAPPQGALPPGYSERDLIRLHAEDPALARRLAVFEQPCWLLIGKDGGVKAKWTHLPADPELYRLIDSMPMRQAEKNLRP